MLKITTVITARQCRLILEGELISPWVEELNREWEDARAKSLNLALVVDLRNATTISQAGEDMLLRMISDGVKFVCGGVLNRHVLQELARRHGQLISRCSSPKE